MHTAAQNFPMPLPTGDSSAASDSKVKLPEYDVASMKEKKIAHGQDGSEINRRRIQRHKPESEEPDRERLWRSTRS